MILFSYNFKHKKTSDFIFHCLVNDIKIDLIIAENKKILNIQSNPFRTKVKNHPLLHPKDISDSLNIPYMIADHNSSEVINHLKDLKPEIGMISGARVLSKKLINNIVQLKGEKTIILISHKMSIIERCDKIIKL